MIKKYVVKNFKSQCYYCGEPYGWSNETYLAYVFSSVEEAEKFIEQEDGEFQIERVYHI